VYNAVLVSMHESSHVLACLRSGVRPVGWCQLPSCPHMRVRPTVSL